MESRLAPGRVAAKADIRYPPETTNGSSMNSARFTGLDAYGGGLAMPKTGNHARGRGPARGSSHGHYSDPPRPPLSDDKAIAGSYSLLYVAMGEAD